MKIDRDPGPRQLAVFGALLPVTFALLGLIVGHRLGFTGPRNGLWVAGALLSVAYAAAPRLRRPLYVGMSMAGYPIGWLVSHVILLVIFLFVVTPVALLLRSLRHDPMQRRFDCSAQSYWVPHRPADHPRRYYQQF
ncbi:MAG TPA: SxtJ family membrane protein [Mycobacterium sp.]|nr:SxtJ family membrane protein [Mycobacterium sp.]